MGWNVQWDRRAGEFRIKGEMAKLVVHVSRHFFGKMVVGEIPGICGHDETVYVRVVEKMEVGMDELMSNIWHGNWGKSDAIAGFQKYMTIILPMMTHEALPHDLKYKIIYIDYRLIILWYIFKRTYKPVVYTLVLDNDCIYPSFTDW